jgi:hypothetical protein
MVGADEVDAVAERVGEIVGHLHRLPRRLRRWTRLRRASLALAIVAAMLAAVGGADYATMPDLQGVIHGCVSNFRGTLRVIDETACTPALQLAPVGPR